jgi:hypothetical protein
LLFFYDILKGNNHFFEDFSLQNLSELTWEDYIKEQAIYILVSRPNNPLGLV